MGQYGEVENQWLQSNNVEEKHLAQNLRQEQQLLAIERREFEREKKLFEMKWKILEEEYIRLAREKQEFQQLKASYETHKRERNIHGKIIHGEIIHGEMFFSGVDSELGMRKRYKDLIKIFHPDNRDGDTGTLQVINKEYDKMKKLFCV